MHILKNMCALAVPNVLAITTVLLAEHKWSIGGVSAGHQSLVLQGYIQYGEQYVVVSCCIKN